MTIPRVLEPEVMDTVDDAADYDAMDHAQVNQQFVSDLLDSLQRNAAEMLQSGPGVLDLGTGTAQIPVQLRREWPGCGPVAACDLSVEMLQLALRNISAAGFDRDIAPLYADAKRLPIRNCSCDLVISNSIIHHIPEPSLVFDEIARVVKNGGVLFVRDLLRPDSLPAVDHLVQTYAGTANGHQQRMFRESLHAALTISEVRHLLTQSGFNPAWAVVTSDRHWTVAGVATI